MNEPVELFIAGVWRQGSGGRRIDVVNPATEEVVRQVAVAEIADLDASVEAAARGYAAWRVVPPIERARILRKAADLLRSRADTIAPLMTTEQGKPIAHAKGEIGSAADSIDWFAEEGRRCFGQVIPGRTADMQVMTRLEPVGPALALSPWNFPISQATRKVAAALAAGCSLILKGPEEAPASCAALVRAFADAGVPAGALNLVFGEPAAISAYLIPHPVIRKVSFTGSVPVGKQLAALAGQHMKRVTMELGGHAPVIICEDADLDAAAAALAQFKFFNAGQVCLSPTRFLVAAAVYEPFLERFIAATRTLKVGNGLQAGTYMGPLANPRRVVAMETLVRDAVERGARASLGGERIGARGYFFSPTILADVPLSARAMNEEPFGPLALVVPFNSLDDALTEANRLPYGLASFAFTRSIRNETLIADRIEAGMLAVNRVFQSLVEAHFGGVKDSGYGTEGGTFAIHNYLTTKMITRSGA